MNALITAALRQRILVAIMLLVVFAGGVVSFLALNIEAYPDPVPPLVDIVTQSTGQSAEEIERNITIPLEIAMAGIPHVQAIRTISLFGLSDTKVQFTYDFTYEEAEQRVTNHLSQLPQLPNGAQPTISPESPIGEIMRYRVVGPPGYSVTDLKTIEDWMLERRFKAVPGVADVNGWGGKTKMFSVDIDQARLVQYGLTVPQVMAALNNANVNVGGQTVSFSQQSAVVRGVGLIHSLDDIRNTMLTSNNGVPVLVSDVATVSVGNQPRLGIAGQDDGDDIVQGIVLMRRGEQSTPTIKRVEAEIGRINGSGILPPGVRIVPIYDRSDLIRVTTHTVLHNMVEGVVLIFVLQLLFLGDLRSAVIVAATIPFALAFANAQLLQRGASEERDTLVVRFLHRIYAPVIRFALANRILALGGMLLMLALAGVAGRGLGLEFLPKLEEGNLWIRATMPTSISLEAGSPYVDRMRRILKSYPEVVTVISQHGRPDDGTDATGFFNAEFFVPLKPFDTWPAGVDKAVLTAQMTARLQAAFPGIDFNFSQYIEDNVEEAASGVKGENSVKLFGGDLDVLERTADKMQQVMAKVPGVTDLAVLSSLGQPTVRIDIDRARAARYGLAPGDVNTTVQAAIGGQAAGNLYEEGSDRNFPMIVRLSSRYRGDLDQIRHILIGTALPSGGIAQIPLSDVADVRLTSGASFIYREGQERYIPIKFSVRGRDLGATVVEAQQRVAAEVRLPGGYHTEWVGEFGNLQEALNRLEIVVPLSIVLICFLLYLNFSSLTDMLLAASVIPMALVGGIVALAATGTPFSVSAAIGFVALFGISAMDGILVVTYFNRMVAHGMLRADAVVQTCLTQMRPVVMTCVVAAVGLLPAAVSNGIGSQVQKPLALVVVGGILLAPVLILTVLPVLLDLFSRRVPVRDGDLRRGASPEPAE